jgi:hypothetical protein
VKAIIMESSTPQNNSVIKPGTKDEKVKFSELSVSGGIINAYEAVEKASDTKGKKKEKGSTGQYSNKSTCSTGCSRPSR